MLSIYTLGHKRLIAILAPIEDRPTCRGKDPEFGSEMDPSFRFHIPSIAAPPLSSAEPS